MTSQETGGVCHLGKRPAQAHGHVCERCERRLPGEGVPAVLTRLIRVGHLPRALATDHARGPRAERRGGALRERVARCARVAPAAAREAQPAVRVLEVLARALVGERLADADAELPELLAAPLAQLLEQRRALLFDATLQPPARARVDGRVCVTRRWVVGRARRVSSTVDGASRAIDGDGERSGVIRSSRFARARRFRSLGARDDIEVRGDGARAQGGGAERGERRGVG